MRQLSPLEFNLLIEAEQEVALDRNEQMAIQAFFNAVGANAKKLKKPSDIYKRPSESELKRAENSSTIDKKLEQQKALEDFTKQLDLSQLK
ncbi:hypothetical protein [Listeria seeligeri]|uniref:hypothetical protein n=1 Tax=Listeria seeligeri TaxID=1640 RepID=UPI0010DD2038|nr:hypothetical protein [Listeria seeligeri]EAC8986530.1 hypothetical protein [Listeria monocytogenes]EAC9001888.1 hypothetical protein [Listeria monocytogenes]EAD0667669.1 hypothetical protein [Listeria monocytogenes]HBI6051899.1 hypothetical protein [Listeria monocytogenes]HBI6456714.1 hypothetical protein [Listeria monocytogenes]